MKLPVKYLSHTISENKIVSNLEKIKIIKNQPIPINVKKIKTLLCLVSYYKKFY